MSDYRTKMLREAMENSTKLLELQTKMTIEIQRLGVIEQHARRVVELANPGDPMGPLEAAIDELRKVLT